jgi:hypothetical protein
MTDLIERLRLGDGTSPDHLLLLEAADALEQSVECMCGICKLGPRPWVGLTDDELVQIGVATGLERAAAQMIESKLKEKNT